MTWNDITSGQPGWLIDLTDDELDDIVGDDFYPPSKRAAARREIRRRAADAARTAGGPALNLSTMAERGMVILDDDGHPLDVRPALRMAGLMALHRAELDDYDEYELLGDFGIRPPLSGACIKLADS